MRILFDNPAIVIILIGMVISFLKRANVNKRTQTNSDTRDMNRIPDIKRELPQRSKSRLEQQYSELKKSAEISQPEAKPEPKITRSRNDRTESMDEIIKSKNVSTNYQKDTSSFTPSNKDIVDGIIWSEILGPPRAMNPHSSRRAIGRK